VPHAHPTTRAPAVMSWTVRRGENFWVIASSVLGARTGEAQTPAQIAPYWAALVRANEGRIASGNPSLIYPGERFIVPPP
jgi:nucleoid-associated protein YgaU